MFGAIVAIGSILVDLLRELETAREVNEKERAKTRNYYIGDVV